MLKLEKNKTDKTRLELYDGKSQEEVFNIVYDINDWSSDESHSGMGSTLKFTENTRIELPSLFKKYNINSILDVACGDFNWMKEIVHNLDYYKGIDIVDKLIEKNNSKYKVNDKVEFETCDIIDNFNIEGKFDAILAKDVLVHFPNDSVLKTLENFKNSGIKYLILTHFDEIDLNSNINSFGQWRPINFTLKPFKMGAPLDIVNEKIETYNWRNKEGINTKMGDKSLSIWEIN